MDNFSYIRVNTAYAIVQAIPESLETDTVTVEIRRLSDGYTWNFSTLAFESGEHSAAAIFVNDIIWKQGFTPPDEDTHIVTIEDETLDVKYIQVLQSLGAEEFPESILTRTTTSDIAICNLALAHLGEDPIVSLTDENKSARSLNRIYELSRDVVLRMKDWRFASVKAALAEVADQEVPGWTYIYAYPAKCLCIRKVFIDVENKNPDPIEYETIFIPGINQKAIACNSEQAYIEFTYQVTDATLFDMAFVNAFSFLLAAQVAKPLTGDDTIAKTMLQIYGSMVSDAARINDIEKYIKQAQTSTFEEAR
jgi:hypothetical protein